MRPDPRTLTQQKENRNLERDPEEENCGAGVYPANLRKHDVLANNKWKKDITPEILDGHSVYDFGDADILQRLEELERESRAFVSRLRLRMRLRRPRDGCRTIVALLARGPGGDQEEVMLI